MTDVVPRVLSIAGTDPSGGAGTAADLKSITAAGGYGMAVVTSLVAQNTTGVRAVHQPPVSFLAAQLQAVSDDVALDGIKTGMLGSVEIIDAVTAWLDVHPPRILVVDPVMVATSGDRLLAADAEDAMRRFARRATVVTPNIGELAVLVGEPPAPDESTALDQAARWASDTGVAVVVKTGHLDSPWATNTWVAPTGERWSAPTRRIDTTSTHGTGCSLSSALATRLAAGDSPADALRWSTAWLAEAIAHGAALGVGRGHGPIDHAHLGRRLARASDPRPWVAEDAIAPEWHAPDELAPDAAAPDPRSAAAAGPWTAALWRAGWATWQETAEGDFVTALVAGTLPADRFDFYLAQDALYLGRYAAALAALAARAPATDELVFWATCAADAQLVEAALHRTWLQGRDPGAMGPACAHYTRFLTSATATEPYPVGAAAVLPCFWLYAETGAILPSVLPDHPYRAWLDTYADPGFVDVTRRALGHVEGTLARATPRERADAARAYLEACRHEGEFFEAATRLGGVR